MQGRGGFRGGGGSYDKVDNCRVCSTGELLKSQRESVSVAGRKRAEREGIFFLTLMILSDTQLRRPSICIIIVVDCEGGMNGGTLAEGEASRVIVGLGYRKWHRQGLESPTPIVEPFQGVTCVTHA